MGVSNASAYLFRNNADVAANFAGAGPYTVMGWVFVTTPIGSNRVCLELGSAGGSVSDAFVWHNSGVAFTYVNGGATNRSTAMTGGNWYHVAIVRSAGNLVSFYLNGAFLGSTPNDVSARVAHTEIACGGQMGFGGAYVNNGLAAFKAWTAALSAGEIANELPYRRAQRTTNRFAEWAMRTAATRQTDDSGNGRSLSSSTGTGWTDLADPAAILGDNPVPSVARVLRPVRQRARLRKLKRQVLTPISAAYVDVTGGGGGSTPRRRGMGLGMTIND